MLPGDADVPVAAKALDLPSDSAPDELAARLRDRSTAFWTERLAESGVAATPVCTDLRALAADPRFDAALAHSPYTRPTTPWEFS